MEPHPTSPPSSYRLPWRERLPAPLQSLAGFPWWQLAVALVVGLILAQQIVAPHSRVIKALAGLLLLLIAIRSKPFWTLCFIALLIPFPFDIFIGSSTLIFVGLAATITLARITLRQAPPLSRTPVDIGIGLLAAFYLLSFYNVENPILLRGGVFNVIAIFASLVLFYLVANLIRTEAQLRKFVGVLAVVYGLCVFVGLYELFFPGRVLIPHWILNRRKEVSEDYYRVSGPFYDFELFAEFLAMGFFLVFFLYRRSTTPNGRFFTGSLSVLLLFVMLSTVTRGATLAFLGGVAYLLWLIRSQLKIRDVSAILLVGTGVSLGLEFLVANFTRSGSIFQRLLGTRFVGITPDSRLHWPEVWDRILEHPFLGHGPYYDLGLSRGITGGGLYTFLWPHNQYLYYAHTIGLLGLGAFLYIAGRLVWISYRDRASSLQSPSYARSLMVVLHVMLLIFLVDQIKIEHLRNSAYQYVPWLLMGLIVATHRIIRNETKEAGGAPPPASVPVAPGPS